MTKDTAYLLIGWSSYWNEADYEDPHWQVSHWGRNYPRLLALKRQHDPQGLFYGHHAVGSELWSEDGNCRLGNTSVAAASI